jgi:hypothetical protein
MPNVLVVGGKLKCNHGGMLQLSSGSSLLEIAGADAIASGMEAGLSFSGGPDVLVPCPLPAPSGPPGSSPCTATLAATAGTSSLLSIGGVAALLDSASGQTVNANDPNATWSVDSAGQTLLSVDK